MILQCKSAPLTMWAQPNEWGYRLNINHPNVKRAYVKYQQEHGLDLKIAMTDAQRHAFEAEIINRLRDDGYAIPPIGYRK